MAQPLAARPEGVLQRRQREAGLDGHGHVLGHMGEDALEGAQVGALDAGARLLSGGEGGGEFLPVGGLENHAAGQSKRGAGEWEVTAPLSANWRRG